MNNRALNWPVSKQEVNYELSPSRIRLGGNLIVAILMCLLTLSVTSKAFLPLPYGLMAKAAASDESLSSQARSEVIKTKWKAKLVTTDGPNDLRLKTFVLMQRGFVVGFVDSESRETQIKEISGTVGLRSLDCYLPRRGKTDQVSESALQLQGPESRTPAFLVKLQIKAALAQHGLREPLKVDVVVLNDTAVLVGIVDNEQERATVLAAAKNTRPIQQVVDFLLLPEPGYEKLLRLP
jgi:osmotically-inducible protein OsmY